MQNTTIDRTLAEVVNRDPASARVLESFGLDYCCGGRQRLDVACVEAGVDPTQVIDALDALEPAPPAEWTSMGPVELVDHLEATHHAYLHAELPRLDALTEKVIGAHGARHPELVDIQRSFLALRAELEPHLMKEERVLFPLIRELATGAAPTAFQGGSVRNPISVMMTEHDRAGELLAELRQLTGAYVTPADGCASYRALFDGLAELEADTHLHVHKENNVLFPAVVTLEDQRAPQPS